MIKKTKLTGNVLTFEFSIRETAMALSPNVNLTVCQSFFKDFQDYLKAEYKIVDCENGFFNSFKNAIVGEENIISKVAVVDDGKVFWEYRANFSVEVPQKEIPLPEVKSNTSRHLNKNR